VDSLNKAFNRSIEDSIGSASPRSHWPTVPG
jgi:hypothetical protein